MSDPWRKQQEIAHRMQDELTRLQQGSSHGGADAAESAAPAGTGEALDGKVQVTVTGGRISDVQLDPRVMRIPSQDLAAAFRDAANAAIADQNTQAEGLPAVPSVDQLARTLNEIAVDSVRAMEETSQGVRDAIGAVQRVSELHRRDRR